MPNQQKSTTTAQKTGRGAAKSAFTAAPRRVATRSQSVTARSSPHVSFHPHEVRYHGRGPQRSVTSPVDMRSLARARRYLAYRSKSEDTALDSNKKYIL